MLDPANAKTWLFSGGYLPMVKAVNDDPEVQAFWTDDLAGVLLFPATEQLGDADPDQPGPLIGPVPRRGRRARGGDGGASCSTGADIPSTLADAQDTVTESLERYAG